MAITWVEFDAAGLRQLAARSDDANAARRMLALALVLDDRSREEAAKICGMDRQPFATGCIVTMIWVWPGCRGHPRGRSVELWWQDEARVGQQGTLTYTWADKGSRPPAPRDCRYSRAYIFGAVCPARGTGAALVLP